MTNLYTTDHSKIPGYLRNHDPLKEFFLLPHNEESRPLIVPQEYLSHFDDNLLPCNIPTQIVKPNFCSSLRKPFLLWFKQNKNVLIRIINPLQKFLSNIHKPLVISFLPC